MLQQRRQSHYFIQFSEEVFFPRMSMNHSLLGWPLQVYLKIFKVYCGCNLLFSGRIKISFTAVEIYRVICENIIWRGQKMRSSSYFKLRTKIMYLLTNLFLNLLSHISLSLSLP